MRPLTPADPTSVGRYTLTGRLGAGGMGTVYRARGPAGEDVAVKVLHDHLTANPQFLARFADEADVASRVAGFCTAKVLHADVDARPPYLVTEYVAGPTLHEVLGTSGPLPASEVEALAVGVAAALTAIHAAGLAHRDLKPSNVLLSRLGPKVIDFGIARALDAPSDRTEAGMLFGTPGWLAPEQLYGKSTQASDVFVWGLLIATAGTDWRPASELRVTVPDEAKLATLPRPVAEAVTAALTVDPAARPTAQALLLRLCGSADTSAAGPVRVATKVLSRPWDAPYPTALGPPPATAKPPTRQVTRVAQPQTSGKIPPYVPPTSYPQYRPPAGHPANHHPRYQPPTYQPIQAFRPLPRPAAPAGLGPPRPAWTPPPKKRRRWYTRKRFILLALLLLIVVLVNQGDGTPDALPPGTARDGILEFTVTGWRCGLPSLGEAPVERQAQGQLCTFDLTVRNFGEQARQVHPGSQKLRDAAGREFSADGEAWIYLQAARPFGEEINPGNEVAATLVYDIATDSEPQELEVHDSIFSGGASLRLP